MAEEGKKAQSRDEPPKAASALRPGRRKRGLHDDSPTLLLWVTAGPEYKWDTLAHPGLEDKSRGSLVPFALLAVHK